MSNILQFPINYKKPKLIKTLLVPVEDFIEKRTNE